MADGAAQHCDLRALPLKLHGIHRRNDRKLVQELAWFCSLLDGRAGLTTIAIPPERSRKFANEEVGMSWRNS